MSFLISKAYNAYSARLSHREAVLSQFETDFSNGKSGEFS